jgi:cysteinyl-tRNA synthetase
VTYVRNITDIDDKIIKRAVENGETMSALTNRFIDAMHEDADALGVQRPDHEPRATQYVPQMLNMIGKLQQNGLAYQATDGDVNYAVRKFPGYGKLSGKSLEDLRAGERVAANDAKQDPLDFVLWKSAKADEPAESRWASPWGEGRPGWHIECSAMSCDLLGEHFDLHGGGADLQFPHHENEIAQSEGANGNTFVNLWMHNGFVRINDEKMSKSLGNFFTIRDVLKVYDPEVVRFFMLRSHYRSDINYSDAHLDDARHALTRLYTALKDVPATPGATPDWNEPHGKHFRDAMNDDFNTPVAVSVLFELASEVNKTRSTELANQLSALSGVMGLLGRDPHVFLQSGVGADGLDAAAVEARIEERRAAKAARDFARADGIRADLLTAGIVLEDKPGGVTEWRRA